MKPKCKFCWRRLRYNEFGDLECKKHGIIEWNLQKVTPKQQVDIVMRAKLRANAIAELLADGFIFSVKDHPELIGLTHKGLIEVSKLELKNPSSFILIGLYHYAIERGNLRATR